MKNFKQKLINIPVLGQIIIFFYRAHISLNYFKIPFKNLFFWLIQSNETTNFTYDLTETNINYLCSLITYITGKEFKTIESYALELINNDELQNHISYETNKKNIRRADNKAKYSRRIGWYIFVRATKPKIVIETGVDKGLGSCVITEALHKNSLEGNPGYYYGLDINPNAGYLFTEPYKQYGELKIGDSIESLKGFNDNIDFFINDSDHSAIYEHNEYQTIKNKLTPQAIILGDNSHCTNELFQFSLENNRDFIFFKETPLDHWYPGAGIGISIPKKTSE